MIYIDTSALLKLVVAEPESAALATFLGGRRDLVASTLLAVEARRSTLRAAPALLPRVDLLLSRVDMVDVTGPVVEAASRLPDPLLRPLDAIHLATALLLQDELEALLTYDVRLAGAAHRHRLQTASPA